MSKIAGISTHTNTKSITTKIKVDLNKHSNAKVALADLGLNSKNKVELVRVEFYKEFNDPKNDSLDECFDYVHRQIATWKWEK